MSDIDSTTCFAFIQTQAQEHANAKGNIVSLEAKLKSVKAVLMDNSDASSLGAKEIDAYKDMRFLECANELAREVTKEAKLNTLIKAAFAKLETHRAELYMARQELKNLG